MGTSAEPAHNPPSYSSTKADADFWQRHIEHQTGDADAAVWRAAAGLVPNVEMLMGDCGRKVLIEISVDGIERGAPRIVGMELDG